MENLEEITFDAFDDKCVYAEVRARFTYADGLCRMAWDSGKVWIETRDTSTLDKNDIHPRTCRLTTPDVAAATAALIIAGDIGEPGNPTNTALYAIAEPFWTGVPSNLRPIP